MIVQNRKLWAGAYDLSGYLSGLAFEASAEIQDDTVFGDSSRSGVAGLVTYAVEQEGVWEAGTGTPDPVLYTNLSLADVLATVAPVNGSEGSNAYFMQTTEGKYSLGGEVGSLQRFSASLQASGGYPAVRGTIMTNGTKTSTGNSAAKTQLGAVSSTQKLYAGLHVLAASGTTPTLDVTIRSDADSSAGGETTRITFAQQTAIGSVWATPISGAITDTYWDVRWVIGGTGPSFTIVVVVAIQ